MHDPMVVAWEVVLPIPVRRRCLLNRSDPRRWFVERRRRTNADNLGEPVYRWWRPAGYRARAAGHALGLWKIATIWHVEPGGRDSGEVCKHWAGGKPRTAWRWHVHHWKIQTYFVRALHRRLFERCIRCGRAYPWGYSPISHQWDEPRARWWHVERRAYHHECSTLIHVQREVEHDHEIIRGLVAYLRTVTDKSEQELDDELCDYRAKWAEHHVRWHLEHVLGYERDHDVTPSRLVKKAAR